MEGFFPSPAGGWVTSAPRKMTGCWNTRGLQRGETARGKHRGISACYMPTHNIAANKHAPRAFILLGLHAFWYHACTLETIITKACLANEAQSDYSALVESMRHRSPALGQQDVVDPAQLDVDLQAEVGERLGGGLLHVLHLDTLGGHAQHRVPHALHLGWDSDRQGGEPPGQRCTLCIVNMFHTIGWSILSADIYVFTCIVQFFLFFFLCMIYRRLKKGSFFKLRLVKYVIVV